MLTNFQEHFLEYFNKFNDQLLEYFKNNDDDDVNDNFLNTINVAKALSKEDKLATADRFVDNMTPELFELFVASKLKVFSHKNDSSKKLSESLFGESLTLKQLLNNQTDAVKKTIWVYIHVLFLYSQLSVQTERQNPDYIERLTKLLNINPQQTNEPFDKTEASDRIYNLLNVTVNDDTKSMIDDIVNSFDPLIEGKDANPISSIMQISQTISSKYADKINSGDIELEKLMESIKDKVPGMSGIIDNFNNMKASTGKETKPKEKVIIDENYSTSKIDLGENTDNKTSSFNIGKILKTVDSLGVLPGGSAKDKKNSSNEQNTMPSMPGMEEMFKMIQSNEGMNKMMDSAKNSGQLPDINDMMKVMQNSGFADMMKSMDMSKMMIPK